MRKYIAILVCTALICCSAFTAWIFLKMNFAGSAYYTEQNKLEYEFYTPDLLKNMPRISNDYRFEFGNVSGPEAHVFTVRIYGSSEIKVIRDYLKSVGYEPQSFCDVKAECWRTHASNDVVTVAKFTSPDCIFVQIYRSPHTQPLIN